MTVDEQLLLSPTCKIAVRYLLDLTSLLDDVIMTSLEVILLFLQYMKLVRFRTVFATSSEVILIDQNMLKLRAS